MGEPVEEGAYFLLPGETEGSGAVPFEKHPLVTQMPAFSPLLFLLFKIFSPILGIQPRALVGDKA